MTTQLDSTIAAGRLVEALRTRDWDGLATVLARDVLLRAVVPTTVREAEGAAAAVERLRIWFGDLDSYELVDAELEPLVDRTRLRWRLVGDHPEDGPVVVEQVGYATVVDGRIARLDLACSGFQPDPLAG